MMGMLICPALLCAGQFEVLKQMSGLVILLKDPSTVLRVTSPQDHSEQSAKMLCYPRMFVAESVFLIT